MTHVTVNWKNVSTQPDIEVEVDGKELFTIVIVDPDAPSPLYVHLLYYNVSISNPGDVIQSYTQPSPPNGEYHRYKVLVYTQHGKRKTNPKISKRSGFDISELGFSDADIIVHFTCKSNGKELKC